MRWRAKARLQSACAALPQGDRLYRSLQQRFGTLAPDPFRRLPEHAKMVRRLHALSVSAEGSRCIEVGTGHMPVAPIGFYLAGAAEVLTVDLHRRMDLSLTTQMLLRLVAEQDRVLELYSGVVEPAALRDRLEVVRRLAARPMELLEQVGIRYLAPGDAAALPDADGSYDIHFSITVLEHIEPAVLSDVLREARRVLAPGGVAVHFVDPSDHFAHQDPSIPFINFLRYSERQWQRIAGNEFSYTNRLRASELELRFREAGFDLARIDRKVDQRSLAAVEAGFPLNAAYRGAAPEDLCTSALHVYARQP